MTPSSSETIERHIVLGAGPLGRATAVALRAAGRRAVLVNRAGRLAAAPEGVELVAGDILAPSSIASAVRGASAIYFCAQPAYHRWTAEFIPLQRAAIACAAETGAPLIVAENLYGYGRVDRPMTEETPLNPHTRKGVVRAAMHAELMAAHHAGRIVAAVARGSDFFGPFVDGSSVGARAFRAVVAGGKPEVFGDCDTLHSYTFVDDFGAALAKLGMDRRSHGQVWHVPNAAAISTRRFFDLACQIAERQSTLRRVGRLELGALGLFIPAVREMIEILYQFDGDFVVDHRKFVAAFGDHSTPLEAAISRTVEWTRSFSR